MCALDAASKIWRVQSNWRGSFARFIALGAWPRVLLSGGFAGAFSTLISFMTRNTGLRRLSGCLWRYHPRLWPLFRFLSWLTILDYLFYVCISLSWFLSNRIITFNFGEHLVKLPLSLNVLLQRRCCILLQGGRLVVKIDTHVALS